MRLAGTGERSLSVSPPNRATVPRRFVAKAELEELLADLPCMTRRLGNRFLDVRDTYRALQLRADAFLGCIRAFSIFVIIVGLGGSYLPP